MIATPSLSSIFFAVVKRDMRLAWSQGGGALLAIGFFLIAVSLFPFGIGPAPQTLARIAAGVIWVVALLAVVISLDRLFQADFEDGSLEDLLLSPLGTLGVVTAKILAHWVSTCLPLVLVAPALGVLMNLPDNAYMPLVLSLLIGTPALSLIGGIGASLTVAVRRGGVLMLLLILPLYVPTLIFGVGAVEAVATFTDPLPHFALLGATTLAAVIVGLFASTAALKLAME